MAKWSRFNLLVLDPDGAVLFNTRTGALIRLTPARQREMERPARLSPDFLEFLLQHGYLIGDEVDEIHLIKTAYEAAQHSNQVFSATIELTEACNFQCLYCYQVHAPRHLSDEIFEKVFYFLSQKMREVQHFHVNWFGGEPLIRRGALKRYAQRLANEAQLVGCTFSQFITTNGYYLSPWVARELAEIGIENVQITLDGDEETHNRLRVHATGKGTYQQVLAACENVVAAGIKLLVRINVNRWNAGHIENLLADLSDKGISPQNTVIHATRTVDHGNGIGEMSSAIFTIEEFAREWVRILQTIVKNGFSLPSIDPIAYNCPFDLPQTVMIGRDGSIRHCSSSDERIADLTGSGDKTNHTPLYKVAKDRNPLDDLKCRECLYLPLCMGGCSYLQKIGQVKCNPECYVLPELIRLTACQVVGN